MLDFTTQAQKLKQQLIQWRRWCHQHPGLGFDVDETAKFIEEKLASWQIKVETNVGQSGVVGIIQGQQPGPCIGIRADMDALPIQEENTHDFVSKYAGKMHACGHDAHVAMGLGVAYMLSLQRQHLAGKVVMIFQPAEEGQGGARAMIEDGVLSRHGIDAMVGCHIGLLSPELETGQVGISYGPIMAATHEFSAEIIGKGGHGAQPHETVDPVPISAQVIDGWQRVVSREVPPLTPAVVTVGSIHAGQAHNIIPEKVEISGTIRFFHPQTGDILLRRVEEVLAGISGTWKAQYKFELDDGYPPLVNDQEFTAFFADIATRVTGPENVKDLGYASTGGEDMAYFLQQVPGTYFFLGAGNPTKGIIHPHHHPRFDIDEDVLPLGAALLAETAWQYIQKK